MRRKAADSSKLKHGACVSGESVTSDEKVAPDGGLQGCLGGSRCERHFRSA